LNTSPCFRHSQRPSRGVLPLLLAGVLLLGLVVPAGAQSKPTRIAVVDVDQVSRRSASIRDAVKEAENRVKPQSERADAKLRELQGMRQNLNERRSVLKPEEVTAEESKIQKMSEEINDLQYEVNKEIDRVQREVMEPQVKRIMRTVDDVARREGYDLVLGSDKVLFHGEALDLTPLVIQALDQQGAHPAAAASSTSSTQEAKPKSATKKSSKSSSSSKSRGKRSRVNKDE